MQRSKGAHSLIKAFNRKKGYNTSVCKAVDVALSEERPFKPNRLIMAFLVYTLCKCYFRFYKWATQSIYFKHGVAKFNLWALSMSVTHEGRTALDELKKEMFADGIDKQ